MERSIQYCAGVGIHFACVRHTRLPGLQTSVHDNLKYLTFIYRRASMLVRQLATDDLDAFWALRLRALTDNPEAFGSTYEETVARGKTQMLQRLGQASESFSLGAFDDTLIGTAGFHRDKRAKERHRGSVYGVYVVPERRRQGAGKALMQELIARVKRLEGLEQLNLVVVTSEQAACRLYLSLGFEIYGTAPRVLKQNGQYWDEYLMVLYLQ
jgi:ribosomal protein S18 acetylase RimI-like enzyme